MRQGRDHMRRLKPGDRKLPKIPKRFPNGSQTVCKPANSRVFPAKEQELASNFERRSTSQARPQPLSVISGIPHNPPQFRQIFHRQDNTIWNSGFPVLVIATAGCFAIKQLTSYIGVVNLICVGIFKLENTAFSTPIT